MSTSLTDDGKLRALSPLASWLADNGVQGGRIQIERNGTKCFASLARPERYEDVFAYWNRAAAKFEGTSEFTCLRIGDASFTLNKPAEPLHRYAW